MVLLGACSHDAPRQNPLDPELTPAVTLEAVVHDSTGAVTLSWSLYAGEQPFAAYRVERKTQGQEEWVALDTLTVAARTTFVDATLAPGVPYDYRVVVVSGAGFNSPSNKESVAGYSTGAVQLYLPETDGEAGAVLLRWSRYRDPGFSEYQVRRRQSGTDRDTTLFRSATIDDTTWADTTALHGTAYLYTVEAEVAGLQLSSVPREGVLLLTPVSLTRPVFTSSRASAALEWSPYTGPRFQAYEIRRQSQDLAWRIIDRLENPAVTSYADSSLVGGVDYAYAVSVRTTRDEEVVGGERTGRFHDRLDEWPLALEEGDRARLYRETPGRLTVLAAGPTGVRLLVYDLSGALLEVQKLLPYPFPSGSPLSSFDTATLADGRRVLSLVTEDGREAVLLLYTAGGQLLWTETQPFADELPVLAPGEAKVLGVVGLLAYNTRPIGFFSLRPYEVAFGNVTVTADDQVIDLVSTDGTVAPGWVVEDLDGEATTSADWLVLSWPGAQNLGGESLLRADKLWRGDPAWEGGTCRADVMAREGQAGILVGDSSFEFYTTTSVSHSSFALGMDPVDGSLELLWQSWASPEDAAALERSTYITRGWNAAYAFKPGIPYRLGLEIAGDRLIASVGDPVQWTAQASESVRYTALAAAEDQLLAVAGVEPYLVSSQWNHDQRSAMTAEVGAARLWSVEVNSREQTRMGLCQPEGNQVLVGLGGINRTTGELRWVFESPNSVVSLSRGVGNDPGWLLFPLSVDGGRDGRTYVLDAGNARVQVFTNDGEYITHWGERGSGPGQFDFGAGLTSEGFSGGLALDDDGYIYVADVGNRRIQKFAP